MLQDGTSDTETLLLSTRDIRTTTLDVGVILIWELLDEFISLSQFTSTLDLFVCCIGLTPTHIFLNGSREEDILLQDNSYIITKSI